MGAALEKLGAEACERIAGELLTLTHKRSGKRIGVHCPWHKEKDPGACWYDPENDVCTCFSCGEGGDLIEVFCAVQGLPSRDPESFREFFRRYAPGTALKAKDKSAASTARSAFPQWGSRPTLPPCDAVWTEKAAAWVNACTGHVGDAQFARLLQWGITPDTVERCRIGYQPKDKFVPFTAWGLPYAENAKGRERHIHLPHGFVFPVFSLSGELMRVKVRLENPRVFPDEPEKDDPKYKAIMGGSPSCYGIWGDARSLVWFVVETERDGMLLWQELSSYGIGAMSTGSASMPPDRAVHELLQEAILVVNALDNDHAGIRASWGFDPQDSGFRWNRAHSHCVRWPVPPSLGKDPADLIGKASVQDWALSALPLYALRRCEAFQRSLDRAAFAAKDTETF